MTVHGGSNHIIFYSNDSRYTQIQRLVAVAEAIRLLVGRSLQLTFMPSKMVTTGATELSAARAEPSLLHSRPSQGLKSARAAGNR